MSDGTCKTCRHWARTSHDADRGFCDLADSRRPLIPLHPESRAVAYSNEIFSAIGAVLATAGDFGCNQHDARPDAASGDRRWDWVRSLRREDMPVTVAITDDTGSMYEIKPEGVSFMFYYREFDALVDAGVLARP